MPLSYIEKFKRNIKSAVGIQIEQTEKEAIKAHRGRVKGLNSVLRSIEKDITHERDALVGIKIRIDEVILLAAREKRTKNSDGLNAALYELKSLRTKEKRINTTLREYRNSKLDTEQIKTNYIHSFKNTHRSVKSRRVHEIINRDVLTDLETSKLSMKANKNRPKNLNYQLSNAAGYENENEYEDEESILDMFATELDEIDDKYDELYKFMEDNEEEDEIEESINNYT